MERLERLDNDLTSGNKTGQYLYASRGPVRIAVYVEKTSWLGYRATAYVNGRQQTQFSNVPSGAFNKVLRNIRYQFERMGATA